MLQLQYFGHLMQRADSLQKTLMLRKIEGRRRRGKQRMRCLDSVTDVNGHESEQAAEAGEGPGSSHTTVRGVMKSRTQLSN